MSQQLLMSTEFAAAFQVLHTSPPLVLPNAWDAGSARLIQLAGAKAIATTSSGVAWTHGRQDGHHMTRAQAVQSVRSIVRAVDVPVTADAEGGYGTGSVNDVAETVRGMLDAGAVGVNLEDGTANLSTTLLPASKQAKRIARARAVAESSGIPLYINARVDVFLRGVGRPESRLKATLERAQMYLDAGASGIFVPGVSDQPTIEALASVIPAPLNIMAGPTSPSLEALGAWGVRRISLGPSIALAAFGMVERAARELLSGGTFAGLEAAPSFADMNSKFLRREE